jgi:hypothetical protein
MPDTLDRTLPAARDHEPRCAMLGCMRKRRRLNARRNYFVAPVPVSAPNPQDPVVGKCPVAPPLGLGSPSEKNKTRKIILSLPPSIYKYIYKDYLLVISFLVAHSFFF